MRGTTGETRISRIAAVAAVLIATAALAWGQPKTEQPMKERMDEMMRDWPKASQEAAAFLNDKYGPPASMSHDLMVWGKTGPWKRTVVYRTEHPHDFPAHHTDVMQQWIDYKAVSGKYNDLADYDGSVVVERTAGEISARCDKEGANFLALNLANEIITGKRSVRDARKMYGEQITAMKAKQPAPYTERLLFSPMSVTEDPDHPLK